MNSFSGVYNAVPLRLISGISSAPVRVEQLAAPLGTTGWASPPPPSISNRLIAVIYLSALFVFGGFVIAGNTLLR